ncbi:MCE family protein [Amycolatopsis acidicola]|uniref:MCE family protein n=1 Tax=Amycolatopsis acidicola TaxID=2596893 RepID=A0A5N0V7J2_9PSEU|nr:MCE family protein [Amycolatopsis acidicola]KAA9160482.1 MCE family protein [Amycolatopsis acidicola]
MMARKSAISVRGDLVKVGTFTLFCAAVMVLLAAQLSGTRFSSENTYHAAFTDVSELKSGDDVQIAGVTVGSVKDISLEDGKPVVEFTADRDIALTQGVRLAVRYKNLLGDRYLELSSGPGADTRVAPGATIPASQTSPALDLDSLLGGFEPLFQGLQPDQINQLSGELIGVLQGEGGTVQDLLAHVGSLTSALADRDQVIGDVITNLNTVLTTVNQHGDQFSTTLVTLQQLVSGLSADRATLGAAFGKIGSLAGSFAQLLDQARPDLQGTVDEFNRTLGAVDKNKDELDQNLRALPGFYQRVARDGSYGSFFNFYICSIRVKLSGPDGNPLYTPWIGPNSATQRCEFPK